MNNTPYTKTIDNVESKELAYVRVQKTIRRDILRFKWQPDALIPSEPELAKTHGVSTGTVKKAVLNLVAEGFLYRIQGKGTYVAGSPFHKEKMRFYRSHECFHGPELRYSTHFLSCSRIPAYPSANNALRLGPDKELIRVGRIMRMAECPYVLIYSYFDAQTYGGLLQETPERFETETMTMIFERSYQTVKKFNQELLSATACTEDIARLLEIPPGAPVLCSEMLSYAYKSKPYEYRESFCIPRKKIYREWD